MEPATVLAGKATQSGLVDGVGSDARFNMPWGLAIDDAGNLYVADFSNSAIRKVSPAGSVTTLAKLQGRCRGVAVDKSGFVYAAVEDLMVIQKISPAGGITVHAGKQYERGNADGTSLQARFQRPVGLAFDHDGNLFVTDYDNHNIRKITPLGDVTTVAGKAAGGGMANGTSFDARFYAPTDVLFDLSGSLLVADSFNRKVRKIAADGSWVSSMAAVSAYRMAWENTGAIIATDFDYHCVHRLDTNGGITLLAGKLNTSGSQDGLGEAARFNGPNGGGGLAGRIHLGR